MRRLLALCLLVSLPCAAGLNSEAVKHAPITTQRSGIRLQSNLHESGSELKGDLTIGLDADDAIRIAQNSAEQPFAVAFPAGVTHAGRDGDSIYWGIWNTKGMQTVSEGRVQTSPGSVGAMPYVAGIPSRSLPQGAHRYSLVGAPFIVSGANNAYAPVLNADNRSSPIDPGAISRADLAVDFDAGTATLKLHFAARGVGADAVIELKRRKAPSLAFESLDCDDAATCSTATLNFYGNGATHAGVLLTVYYDRLMPQSEKVGANLSNVLGTAAIGLKLR